jgi:hypothetical protein
MSPEEAVLARLLGISDLTALVSTRIYMLKLPQHPTLPAVRVQKIASVRDQHLRGPGHLYRTRVQVDAYAAESSGSDPYQAVSAVAAAIRGDGLGESASGLWGWIGDAGGSPSLRIYNAELVGDDDPFYEAAELRAVRIRQDYLIHWSE